MFANAGRIFVNAVESCQELSAAGLTSAQIQRRSLAAILFSTISTEAFINELHHQSCFWAGEVNPPGWTKALCEVLGEAEKARASIESKYHLAKYILSGEPFDRGAAPFQTFALLIDIRNLIVHAKPLEAIVRKNEHGKYVWSEPKVMVRLQEMNVVNTQDLQIAIAHNPDRIVADLVVQISTQATAKWACKAASGIVSAMLDAVPVDFARITDVLYRDSFIIPDDFERQ